MITVTPVNDAPVRDPLDAVEVTATELTFTATATDVDSDPLSFGLAGAPAGAGIDSVGVFHWTPGPNQLGTFTFDVCVSDGVAALVCRPVTVTTLGLVNGDLLFVGTGGNDRVAFNPASSAGAVEVLVNGVSQSIFDPTGKLIAYRKPKHRPALALSCWRV